MDAAVFCRVWAVPAQEPGGSTAQICSVLFGAAAVVQCAQGRAQLQALCDPSQMSWLMLLDVFPSPCCNWNNLVFLA